MTQVEDPQTSHWHLDKRVPLALIVTIAIQTAAALWWAASVTFRVDGLIDNQAETKNRIAALEHQIVLTDRQSAVIEQQLKATNDNLSRLRADVQETNALLREAFQIMGARP